MEQHFTITSEDRIEGHTEISSSTNDLARFSSEQELLQLTRAWPMRRLITLWNNLPGVQAVVKFETRAIAVSRIWRRLTAPPATKGLRAKAGSKTRRIKRPQRARENSKAAAVIYLLEQAPGATLGQIMAATGWQAHSVRGFLSNLGRKRGFRVRSRQHNGLRLYSIQS